MARFLKTLLTLALILALAAPVGAQVVVVPPPLPPGPPPQFVPVPGYPVVLYAPKAPGDLFRHKHKYYYYYGGNWYRGKGVHGPWKPVRKIPRALYKVQRSYFKAPPPW